MENIDGKTTDRANGFLIGFCIGVLAMLFLGIIIIKDDEVDRKALRVACELELARSQKCVMQYIPEKVLDK